MFFTSDLDTMSVLKQLAEANDVSFEFCAALVEMDAPTKHEDALVIKVAQAFKVTALCLCALAHFIICIIAFIRKMASKKRSH